MSFVNFKGTKKSNKERNVAPRKRVGRKADPSKTIVIDNHLILQISPAYVKEHCLDEFTHASFAFDAEKNRLKVKFLLESCGKVKAQGVNKLSKAGHKGGKRIAVKGVLTAFGADKRQEDLGSTRYKANCTTGARGTSMLINLT